MPLRSLSELLKESAALHRHLCPRQVLGVRMGMYAGELLGLELPQSGKRLLTIVETDGCTADGIAVATNCWVGRRTLRIEDYGKIAATFVDTESKQAVRIHPRTHIRSLAPSYAPQTANKWEAQLIGYQHIVNEILLNWQWVELNTDLEQLISYPGAKAVCSICGEEIINQREVVMGDRTLCRACAGGAYYTCRSEPVPVFAALKCDF